MLATGRLQIFALDLMATGIVSSLAAQRLHGAFYLNVTTCIVIYAKCCFRQRDNQTLNCQETGL
jgi:hypothetical protein